MAKNIFFKTCIGLLIVINIILSSTYFYKLGKNEMVKEITKNKNSSGKIQIKVLESNTNNPIDGATVCIIETRHYENTNKYGKTKFIEVPIIRNVNFDLSHPRIWGEITLLVYKNGYRDNIIFYTRITPDSTRVDIVVHLTPIISESDKKPDISLEYPNQKWIETLIKLYKKRL